MAYDIIIAGVGGQGTLLSGKILGEYAQRIGKDVKVSEVHGMAQRGGSVVTLVRMDDEVHSPLVEPGEADAIIAFEPLEMLRWAHYLKPGGAAVCATDRVVPQSVAMGTGEYPSNIEERIEARANGTLFIDALAEAAGCGGARAMNVLLMGAFAEKAGLDIPALEQALEACVKPQFLEMNMKALARGREIANNA